MRSAWKQGELEILQKVHGWPLSGLMRYLLLRMKICPLKEVN
jgi:hypothetical protein